MKSIVDAMVRRGHEVTVICEFPNHPIGILDRKDRWRFFRSEKYESYRIIRAFVLTFATKNNIKRMLFYLSFSLSSFLAAICLRRHDVVFSSSPPIFHVFAAMVAAKVKRSKFVLDIRDIWPDTALVFEAVKSNSLLKWGGFLEKRLYGNAILIFTISKGLKSIIEKRGGSGKTFIAYNGSEDDMLAWNGNIGSFRDSQGWTGKVVVCYAGLIGLGQNLSSIVPEIAQIENEKILFVFIGDGPGKTALCKAVTERKLKNVEIKNLMPRSEVIPHVYSSDIMMVILRESLFFKSAIPSKFFDYMAAGKPIITNVDGELRDILEENKTGLYFSLKKKGEFAGVIKLLVDNPDLRFTMGINGKKLIERNYHRSKIAHKLAERIEEII
ncbi:MAG: glycosyltransferase family 4 protein [Candidatus Zixiibacteriota bacterium]|nr:MAG: glycosyltransferase family 4 protein [candidate division Zixibacteria bacterium]